MSENCAICGIVANLSCSACKLVKYCGPEHQKNHWKTHKVDCRPFSISKDEDVGRFLLATRDIKADSVIFTENPLVVGPKWYLTENDENNPVVPCVGCFQPVRVGTVGCPKCNWPVCSQTCQGIDNPKLHGLECPVLTLGQIPNVNANLKELLDYYRMDALVVLKCLMLQRKFPKKWKELIDMQSNEEERLSSELYQDAEKRIVSFLDGKFLNRFRSFEAGTKEVILKESDTQILRKICGIIETNYMCISLPFGLELSSLFYTACMMEHSCIPNCYFQFDHKNGFKISVTAGRDIKKGEHLQIMYSNMLWDTQMRQEHLHLTKHFLCKCQRCQDPTELGTFFSGLVCIGPEKGTCGGIQLPQDPLSQTTDWACNLCDIKLSSEEVRYLMTKMSDEVEHLLAKKPTIRALEDLIEKLSNLLHKNHYHLFNLKHALIQLYGTQSGHFLDQLSDKLLQKKVQLCEDLLDVCEKLDPYTIRLSLYVGVILNELHWTLIEITKRIRATGNRQENEDKIANNYKRAGELLLRAKRVLQKEIDTKEGSKLLESITQGLKNVVMLISKE